MEKESFIISRTMFCPACYQRRKPARGELFVVYNHDHECLAIKENHVSSVNGFTPHLVSWEEPLEVKDGKVQLSACCGVNFCGVYVDPKDFKHAEPGVATEIQFIKTEFIWLPVDEFVALKDKWRGNTGYNLF